MICKRCILPVSILVFMVWPKLSYTCICVTMPLIIALSQEVSIIAPIKVFSTKKHYIVHLVLRNNKRGLRGMIAAATGREYRVESGRSRVITSHSLYTGHSKALAAARCGRRMMRCGDPAREFWVKTTGRKRSRGRGGEGATFILSSPLNDSIDPLF
jgi:hypothetical protein